MIQIHQAIYGEGGRNKGYSLLNSSFPQSDIPTRLGNSTDLIDRPPDTILIKPIIRGFMRDGYFLLIKSFPDLSIEVRRGRIFSHVLIIEEKDFLKLKDITTLLQYHIEAIEKKAKLSPIQIQQGDSTLQDNQEISAQMACAFNALIKHVDYQNTIAWVEEKGYFDWISRLWPFLPTSVKLNALLGVAFNPQKINSDLLNLVYIPSELKGNWANTDFKLIEPSCDETLNSQSANLLAGNQEHSKGLKDLLNDFSLKIEEVDDLPILETLILLHKSLKTSKDLNPT